MKLHSLAFIALLSVAVSGCEQAEQPIENELKEQQSLQELGLSIRRMTGTPEADNPKQCKIVAMGHKPCGGPERYLLYSTKVLNGEREEEFLNKLKRYNRLSAERNQRSDMVSDCQVLPEPTAVIRDGFCIPAEKNTM